MTSLWSVYLYGLCIMLGMGVITWLYSLYHKDVSIVDSLWSLMFLAAAIVYAYVATDLELTQTLLLILVFFWSLRLSIFLTLRNWGQPEDRRYQEIRRNNEPNFELKSLYIVFGLQAVLAWVISVPLLLGLTRSYPVSGLVIFASALWLAGFLFESVADYQLFRFKRSSENVGKVLDTGLWRYSRHPNYFGECLIWWSFYLFAVAADAWWTVFSPVLMTVLLLRVSGVSLMEKDITERRQGYRDYIENTSAFIPWKPKNKSVLLARGHES